MIILAMLLSFSPPTFISSTYENQPSVLTESTIFHPEIFRRISSFCPESSTILPLYSFSNDNFLLVSNKEKIVIRIPSQKMTFLVDRHSEYKNSLLAQKAGFNPLEILFFDPDDGLQITKYLENAIFLTDESNSKEELSKITDVLRKLHTSGIIFENTFNPFLRLRKTLDLLKAQNGKLLAPFYDIYPNVCKWENILEWSCFKSSPCHNDPVPSNFALIDNSFKLIDWEYSGNNDPSWDLAYFSTVLSLSDEQELFFIHSYSPEDTACTQAKMTFFKPVIHLTISAWTALHALEEDTKLSKSWLNAHSAEHLKKCKKLLSSEDFNLAITLLKDSSCH